MNLRGEVLSLFHNSQSLLATHLANSTFTDVRFVTTRIARGVALYHLGVRGKPIRLANVDARRDWGHAKDYARGIWLMLQHSCPVDVVLATGESRSIREFLEEAFGYIHVNIA